MAANGDPRCRGFLVLMTAVVVAACSGSAATTAPTSTPLTTAPGTAAPTPASTDSGAGSAPVSLTFFHYVGSNQDLVPEAVIKQYTADHPNVTINVQTGTNATTFPAIEAAFKTTGVPTVNCGYFNISSVTSGDLDGLWLPLDAQKITHLADFPAADIRPNGMGVQWGFNPIGLVYNKTVVPTPPTSWQALLDPTFAGHVALIDFPLITFNGLVPINRILGGTDGDLSKGYAAYQTAAQAGQFQSIYSQTTAVQNLLVTGDVTLTSLPYGIVEPWVAQGLPIAFAVPQEGEIAFPLLFEILKGSTDAQVAQCEQILNLLLAPENLAKYASDTYTAPTSTQVTTPSSLEGVPAYSTAAISAAMQLDWNTLAANIAQNQASWNSDVKGQLK